MIRQIFNDIVIRDAVVRAGLKKKESIVKLARYLVSNSASEFTYRSLKSVAGTKRSATISEWVSLLEEAYLIFRVERFSPKLKEQFLAPKKVYSVDNGLVNAVGFKITENTGKLMENAVAVELMRRRSYFKPETEMFYFRDSQGHEVDFVIKEGLQVKELIQVTYANAFDEVDHRELRALLKAGDLLKCKELKVITWDYEDEREISWFGRKGRIKFIPFWKWLLNIAQ